MTALLANRRYTFSCVAIVPDAMRALRHMDGDTRAASERIVAGIEANLNRPNWYADGSGGGRGARIPRSGDNSFQTRDMPAPMDDRVTFAVEWTPRTQVDSSQVDAQLLASLNHYLTGLPDRARFSMVPSTSGFRAGAGIIRTDTIVADGRLENQDAQGYHGALARAVSAPFAQASTDAAVDQHSPIGQIFTLPTWATVTLAGVGILAATAILATIVIQVRRAVGS